MAGVNVSVAPEIINWVIEKIQFGTVNNSVFELLNKWKSGEKVPTFNQIEDVSKKTNIPFGYFFLEKTPIENCKIVEYRTVDSLAIQELSRIKISSISWSRLDSNYKKQIIAHPSICIFLYSNHSLISFIRDT